MIAKLLIANRGEIACRVIRTCRRMGISTIAVYSDADIGARHVREADEAVHIGPAPARQSYLDEEAIIRAARQCGADAIHPGYGFLSEKLELIDACADAGIIFVGPHRGAIAQMGSKIESKRIARSADVACLPGYDGDDQSEQRLVHEANETGFPLLIKASAGGGGKGMKLVRTASNLTAQLADAKAEALAAFGDEKVLIERFIERPRHLEVQLLGDRHGNLVHLFERECSIQRNYQKIIEEAPANHLEKVVRQQLLNCALSLGRAIGYDSTGTVEFVLDADDSDAPYFLEMNTRLQVEHTVTEEVTGLDLVEQQILSALGHPLAFQQEDVICKGWAIEARINAEVPEDDFRASYGSVGDYDEPQGAGIRVDSGIDANSVITPHYDSMVAKLIAQGASRSVARNRLQSAVRTLRIGGIETNQAMIDAALGADAFEKQLTTRYLADVFPEGWRPSAQLQSRCRAAAAAAWYFAQKRAGDRPLDFLAGFRVTGALRRGRTEVVVNGPDGETAFVIEIIGHNAVSVIHNGVSICLTQTEAGELSDGGGQSYNYRCEDDVVHLWIDGHLRIWKVSLATNIGAAASGDTNESDAIIAELPGVVSQLLVTPGQEVTAGQPLIVIEAMKLLHRLVARRDGRVALIGPAVGDTVPKGALLVAMVPESQAKER